MMPDAFYHDFEAINALQAENPWVVELFEKQLNCRLVIS